MKCAATGTDALRVALDTAIRGFSGVSGGTYGTAQILVDLSEAGWVVSAKTVAASMARQNLVARSKKKKGGLTRALEARRHTDTRPTAEVIPIGASPATTVPPLSLPNLGHRHYPTCMPTTRSRREPHQPR